jgi:Fe-S oxidoreductase
VATACPFCMTMLKDGLAEAPGNDRPEGAVTTADIAEILADVVDLTPSRGGRQLPVLQ